MSGPGCRSGRIAFPILIVLVVYRLPVALAQHSDYGSSSIDEHIKVLVTGSNIPSVDRETAVPVQVISRDDIQRANVQTAAQLANTISANVSFGTIPDAYDGSGGPGLAAAG